MKTSIGQAGLVGVVLWSLTGCVVGVPPGAPLYAPPAILEEPPVYQWSWWGWPHYDVEHHYVVDHDPVSIHDRHYFPFFGSTTRYIKNDEGKHKGWYKHTD